MRAISKRSWLFYAFIVLFPATIFSSVLDNISNSDLAADSKTCESVKKIKKMAFGYPNSKFQFYHLTYTFKKGTFRPFTLKKINVNGTEVRDFKITGIDDHSIPMEGYQRRYPQYNKLVTGNTDLTLKVRCMWKHNKKYTLSVKGVDKNGQAITLKAEGIPDNKFGYWNPEWKYCATILLKENAGIKRIQEPVHVKMALYSSRLTDPQREIRVVEFNPYKLSSPQGPYREVPCQAYNVHKWIPERRRMRSEINRKRSKQQVRYLPTTTLQVAFLVDVNSYSEKVYLLFYGNNSAEMPCYSTDLNISGPEIGQIIENSAMRVDLDDNSGAIFSILLKQGKNVLLEHKPETNGAIHWNPGPYLPSHASVHTSDWKNPNFEQISGPVFHQTRRWATLPHMDNVLVTITYLFYTGKPYIISSSITEVLEDFYGKALHSGVIVFNHEELNEFAYKSLLGRIKEVPIETSLKHPEHVVDIPYNVPWVAFVNSQKRIGFASIALKLANTNRYGGFSDAEQPYYYVANGPWIYLSRVQNYSFGSNNTSRMIRCAKGSLYFEKTALLPFILGDTDQDKYHMLEDIEVVLKNPLHVTYYLDTDNRNSETWVAPILVEPFDKGIDGAVGHKEDVKQH